MRRVLADTNIVIAALVFPHGIAAQAFSRAVDHDNLVLTAYILDEVRDVVHRKWPQLLATCDTFLAGLSYELIPLGTSGVLIRDAKDQPILDSAISAVVDVIVTGDKAFHALNITKPQILTPRQYLDSP